MLLLLPLPGHNNIIIRQPLSHAPLAIYTQHKTKESQLFIRRAAFCWAGPLIEMCVRPRLVPIVLAHIRGLSSGHS